MVGNSWRQETAGGQWRNSVARVLVTWWGSVQIEFGADAVLRDLTVERVSKSLSHRLAGGRYWSAAEIILCWDVVFLI